MQSAVWTDEQDAGFASDQRVALRGLFALRDVCGANDVHDVGMNLAQRNDAHFARAERAKNFSRFSRTRSRESHSVNPRFRTFSAVLASL